MSMNRRPSHSPRLASRSLGSSRTERPIRLPTISAVSLALLRSDDHSEESLIGATRSANSVAWRRPVSLRGVSVNPCTVIGSRLSSVSPWRARERAGLSPTRATVPDSQRVRAQAKSQGLERQHVIGRDVREVDLRAEAAYEPDLLVLAWRVEHDPAGV